MIDYEAWAKALAEILGNLLDEVPDEPSWHPVYRRARIRLDAYDGEVEACEEGVDGKLR